jgi:type IV pilus assembly protein PilC
VPSSQKLISTDDFVAFNQQLAQLTGNGMPIEQGLKLIAEDLRSGRLKTAINNVTAELDRGTPLAQAFEKHTSQFPSLYSQLISAGVQTNNLPAMLLNIGKHAEMIQRLRQMLWRTMSYPLAMLIGFSAVASFIGWVVLPQMAEIIWNFKQSVGKHMSWWGRGNPPPPIEMPPVSVLMMYVGRIMPFVLLSLILLIFVAWLIRSFSDRSGLKKWAIDNLILPLPIIGPALKWNLLARWCNAVRIGVDASLDLPKAIELADASIASPRLQNDGALLVSTLRSGSAPGTISASQLSLLPASVPATLDYASRSGTLPLALSTLSQMYQQQAELRMASIPTILTPILVIPMAVLLGLELLSVIMPLFTLMRQVT